MNRTYIFFKGHDNAIGIAISGAASDYTTLARAIVKKYMDRVIEEYNRTNETTFRVIVINFQTEESAKSPLKAAALLTQPPEHTIM